MTATLYSKPHCVQCKATRRQLDRAGISYNEINLEADSDALGYVKSLGYHAAPVVVTASGEHWAGFRPDRIKELITHDEKGMNQ